MAISTETLAFERGVRPVMELVLPEKADAVLNFDPDPALKARIEELACKSKEGQLTDNERAEFAGYVRANNLTGCATGCAAVFLPAGDLI